MVAFEIAEESEDSAVVHEGEVIGQLNRLDSADCRPDGGEDGEAVKATLAEEQDGVEGAGAVDEQDPVGHEGPDEAKGAHGPAQYPVGDIQKGEPGMTPEGEQAF